MESKWQNRRNPYFQIIFNAFTSAPNRSRGGPCSSDGSGCGLRHPATPCYDLPMPFPRLPRFKRVQPSAPLRTTQRDVEIVRLVRDHRFLRSSHIRALAGPSSQLVTRRLRALYHHGFLERPRSQIVPRWGGGSRDIVHGLGNKAASLLAGRATPGRGPSRDGPKNRAVGRMFLEHALLVSDILVKLELDCRQSGAARLLPLDVSSPTSPNGPAPHRWRVDLPGHPRLGIVPDKVFALESAAKGAGDPRMLCFLEADRGTMPIRRRDPRQTSMWRKLLAYEATWSQGLHRGRFGLGRLRVLIVTSGKARQARLLEACATLDRGRGIFLLIDRRTLLASPSLLAAPWRDGHGRAATLLP